MIFGSLDAFVNREVNLCKTFLFISVSFVCDIMHFDLVENDGRLSTTNLKDVLC